MDQLGSLVLHAHITRRLVRNRRSLCLPDPGEPPGQLEPPILPTWVMPPSPTKLGRLTGSGEDGKLLGFRAWKPQWPLVGSPVHPNSPSASRGALCTPTVAQPPRWTSPFFPLSTVAVSSCNYSLTFLPTVIPKPVSSYFPKAPLKSTFSTFQIGRDREKMHVFLPRLRLNCCFCRCRSWMPGPLRPQDFRGAD